MNFEIQTWTSTARMHVCVLAFVCISVRLMQIYMDFNTGFLLQTRPTISFSIRFDYILYEFSKHKTKQSKPRKSLSMPHVKYIKRLDIRNICCNLDIISICYSIPFVNPFLCIFIRMFGKSTTLSPNPTIQQFQFIFPEKNFNIGNENNIWRNLYFNLIEASDGFQNHLVFSRIGLWNQYVGHFDWNTFIYK